MICLWRNLEFSICNFWWSPQMSLFCQASEQVIYICYHCTSRIQLFVWYQNLFLFVFSVKNIKIFFLFSAWTTRKIMLIFFMTSLFWCQWSFLSLFRLIHSYFFNFRWSIVNKGSDKTVSADWIRHIMSEHTFQMHLCS